MRIFGSLVLFAVLNACWIKATMSPLKQALYDAIQGIVPKETADDGIGQIIEKLPRMIGMIDDEYASHLLNQSHTFPKLVAYHVADFGFWLKYSLPGLITEVVRNRIPLPGMLQVLFLESVVIKLGLRRSSYLYLQESPKSAAGIMTDFQLELLLNEPRRDNDSINRAILIAIERDWITENIEERRVLIRRVYSLSSAGIPCDLELGASWDSVGKAILETEPYQLEWKTALTSLIQSMGDANSWDEFLEMVTPLSFPHTIPSSFTCFLDYQDDKFQTERKIMSFILPHAFYSTAMGNLWGPDFRLFTFRLTLSAGLREYLSHFVLRDAKQFNRVFLEGLQKNSSTGIDWPYPIRKYYLHHGSGNQIDFINVMREIHGLEDLPNFASFESFKLFFAKEGWNDPVVWTKLLEPKVGSKRKGSPCLLQKPKISFSEVARYQMFYDRDFDGEDVPILENKFVPIKPVGAEEKTTVLRIPRFRPPYEKPEKEARRLKLEGSI